MHGLRLVQIRLIARSFVRKNVLRGQVLRKRPERKDDARSAWNRWRRRLSVERLHLDGLGLTV
jgi:hypothetical protein